MVSNYKSSKIIQVVAKEFQWSCKTCKAHAKGLCFRSYRSLWRSLQDLFLIGWFYMYETCKLHRRTNWDDNVQQKWNHSDVHFLSAWVASILRRFCSVQIRICSDSSDPLSFFFFNHEPCERTALNDLQRSSKTLRSWATVIKIQNVPAAVNSFDVSLVSAEISDALCFSSTARATVTVKWRNFHNDCI